MDLRCTSVVKHSIKLTDEISFEEQYQHILPHQYEEVRKHLEKMFKIRDVQKSHNPWASTVVVVRKKDGGLNFCMNLHKLNSCTVKDAYNLPHIDKMLDCLNGSRLFTSLDLKSGYWHVRLEEASKPLTSFIMGPL